MKVKIFVLIVLLASSFSLTTTVLAQLDLEETYIAEDGSFEFMYPAKWDVDDRDVDSSGFVFLTGSIGRNEVVMGFVGPTVVDDWTGGEDTIEDVVDSLASSFDLDDDAEVEIDNRPAIASSFLLGETAGIAITIEMDDGSVGMVLIITSHDGAMDEISDDVMSIVETFNSSSGGFGSIMAGSDDSPVANLSDYNSDDWRDAIAELEAEGLIGSGGTLIFNEPRAFFDGIGSWFTPLARRTSRRDVVVAGELAFNSDSRDFEACSLMARIVTNPNQNTVDTFLEIGIDNSGFIYWVDREGEDVDSDFVDLNLDLNEAHHILFMALDDRLTVYLDGELVFDNVRIQSRSGSFGIALLGSGADSRCAGSNIWAYDTPIFVPGLCEVTAGGTVNKRSGPGTDFDRAGTLNAGERLEVMSQAVGSDDFVWYELEDESWVREDIISLMGDCGDIPENDG